MYIIYTAAATICVQCYCELRIQEASLDPEYSGWYR